MASFRLRRFCRPEFVRTIAPHRLLTFLEPFREFLSGRGLELPPGPRDDEIDCQQLVGLFLQADDQFPQDLLDALYLVDEMATPPGMDSLLQAIRQERLPVAVGEEDSPADVAVEVWLHAPKVLENKHAEQYLYRARSFEAFQNTAAPTVALVVPSPEACRAIERDLDVMFALKNRGRGVRVFVYPCQEEVCFLVRHGEPFKRDERLRAGDSESICYRPLKYDALVYNAGLGELQVNARPRWQKDLYRTVFGRHLFGDDGAFVKESKYTLEPIREQREQSLVCVDVEGINKVTLKEVEFRCCERPRVSVAFKGDDLFTSVYFLNSQALVEAQIARAVFEMKFSDSPNPRSVTLYAGNVTCYTRDSDVDPVQEWAKKRGFLIPQSRGQQEGCDEVVASA